MFDVGRIYHRKSEIHGIYGGQQQGGISTPANFPLVLIFTGDNGAPYGYEDGYQRDGTFWYTGEGRRCDMTMTKGNAAIRDHQSKGKTLHLFEYVGPGLVRYMGVGTYLGYQLARRLDVDGKDRRAIIFELAVETVLEENTDVSIDALPVLPADDAKIESTLWKMSYDELRQLARQRASSNLPVKERKTHVRVRTEAVRIYVLRRANGKCEGCEADAPFVTAKGKPYLEPHHTLHVADGGPDDPRWVIALCPNCHRRVHWSHDRKTYNEQLIAKLTHIAD